MMPSPSSHTRWSGRRDAAQQRGVIMLVTLLALVIMLIGAVALVRSFNASLFMAGNLAFKRDLVNQGERAAAVVLPKFTAAGALSTALARAANATAHNYSAVNLPSNAEGIPNALLGNTAFAAVGVSTNDIVIADQGVTLRYVVDRMCANPVNEATQSTETCTVFRTPDARGGSASNMDPAKLQPQLMYRLSVRVDGPRNTQAFFQTTFAF